MSTFFQPLGTHQPDEPEFLTDLLTRVPPEKLLEQARVELSNDKQFFDALAMVIGCHLGNQLGIDIYDAACEVIRVTVHRPVVTGVHVTCGKTLVLWWFA